MMTGRAMKLAIQKKRRKKILEIFILNFDD